jgi:hypothetical protein
MKLLSISKTGFRSKDSKPFRKGESFSKSLEKQNVFQKKMILLMVVFLLSAVSASAIQTYVGINILDLKDTVCNKQMKIVSNPGEGYPLHFKVTRNSDSVVLWEGDSTENLDYGTGDIILLPEPIDLASGEAYNLDMDVDMVAIQRSGWKYHSNQPSIDAGIIAYDSKFHYCSTCQETCDGFICDEESFQYSTTPQKNPKRLFVSRSGAPMSEIVAEYCGWVPPHPYFTSVFEGYYNNLDQPDNGLFQFSITY